MAAQLSAYVLAKTEELSHLEAELQALAAQAFAYCGGTSTHDSKPFEDISESVKAAVRAALGAGLFPELPCFPGNGLDQAKRHAPSAGGVAYHDSADVPLLKRLKPSSEDAPGKAENAKPTVNQLAADEVGQPQPPDRVQSIVGSEQQISETSRLWQGSEAPRVLDADLPNNQNNYDSQSLETRAPEAKASLVQPPLGPDANPQRKPESSEERAQPSESQHASQPLTQQPPVDLPTRKRPPLWLRQMLPSRSRPKVTAAMPPKPPLQPTRGKKAPPQDSAAPAETQARENPAAADEPPLPSMTGASADAHPGVPETDATTYDDPATCGSRQALQHHGDDPFTPTPPQADLNPVAAPAQLERAPAPAQPQDQTSGPPGPRAATVDVRPCNPNPQIPAHSAVETQPILQPLLRESSPPGSVQLPLPRRRSTPLLAELPPPSSPSGGSEPPGNAEPVNSEAAAVGLAGGGGNSACALPGAAGMGGTSLPPGPAVPIGPESVNDPQHQRQGHQRSGRRSSPSPSAVSMEPPPPPVVVVLDSPVAGLMGHHQSAPSRRGSTQTITAGQESATAPSGTLLRADPLPPQAVRQGWPRGPQQQEATSLEEGVRKKRRLRVEHLAARGGGSVTEGTAAGRSKGMDAGILHEQLIDMPLASRVRKRPTAALAKAVPAMPVPDGAPQVGNAVGTTGVTGLGAETVRIEVSGAEQHFMATAVDLTTETRAHAADGVEPIPEGSPLADMLGAAMEAEAVAGADGSSDCGQSFGTATATNAAEWAVGGDMTAGGEGSSTPLAQEVVDDWSPPANAAAAATLPASPRVSDPTGRDVGRGRDPMMVGAGAFACEEQGAAPGDVFAPGHASHANSWPCQGGAGMMDTVCASAAAAAVAAGVPTSAVAGLAAEDSVGNAAVRRAASTTAAAPAEIPGAAMDAAGGAKAPVPNNADSAPAAPQLHPQPPWHAPAAPAPEAMTEVGFTGWGGPNMGHRAQTVAPQLPTGAVAGAPVLTLLEAIAIAAAAAAAASSPTPGAATASADSCLEPLPGGHIPPYPRSQSMAPPCASPIEPAHHHAEGPAAAPNPAPIQPVSVQAASTAAAHLPTGTHLLFAQCSAPHGSTTSAPPPPPPLPPPLDPAAEYGTIPAAIFTTTAHARITTTGPQPVVHTAPTTTTAAAAVSAARAFARDSLESYSTKQPSAPPPPAPAPIGGAAAAGSRPAEVPSSGMVHERHHKPAGQPCRRPPLVSQMEVPRDPHAALAAAAAALMAALEGDGEGGDCDLPDFPSPIATGLQAAHSQAAGPAPPPPVYAPPRESDEAAAKRRAAEAARKAAARASESEEKAAKRRAVQAARSALRRAAQPPEEAALKRKAHAARQAAYRKRRKEQRAQEDLDLPTSDLPDHQDYDHDDEHDSSGQEDGPPLSGSVSQSLHDDRSERQEDTSNASHPNAASDEVKEGHGDGNGGLRQEGGTACKRGGPVGGSGTAGFSDASAAAHALDTDEVSSPMREQGGASGGAAACGLGGQAAGSYAAGDAVGSAAQAEAVAGVADAGEAEAGVGKGFWDAMAGEQEAQNVGVDDSGPGGGSDGGLGLRYGEHPGGDGTGSDTGAQGLRHGNMKHAAGARGDLAPEEEEPAGRPMSEVEQEEWRRRAAEIERQRAEAAAEREAARRARTTQRAATGTGGGGSGGGGSGGGGLTSEEDLARRIRQRLEEHHQLATAAAAEAEAKEAIRSQVRARLQETHRKALDERNLTRLLKQLGALQKGASLRSAEQRGKALKAAKIRFHPDKASGGLEARVYAEEVSKLLNSWEWM